MFLTISPLPETIRRQGIETLTPIVECAICAQLCAQDAHWNTKGMAYGPLHALFGDVYDAMGGYADRLAERIVSLGGSVRGSLVLTRGWQAPDFPADQDGVAFVRVVVKCLAEFNARLHEAYGRCEEMGLVGDANAIQSIIEEVEKLGMKLAAHVPNG